MLFSKKKSEKFICESIYKDFFVDKIIVRMMLFNTRLLSF